jgi:uncharacterized membrane protein YqjE
VNTPSDDTAGQGPVDLARRVMARALQLVSTRLELFTLELHEERQHAVRSLGLLAGGALLLVIGLMVLLVAGLLALPPEWRPWAGAAVGLIFITLGTVLITRCRRLLRDRTPPFAASLAELERDREWIRSL